MTKRTLCLFLALLVLCLTAAPAALADDGKTDASGREQAAPEEAKADAGKAGSAPKAADADADAEQAAPEEEEADPEEDDAPEATEAVPEDGWLDKNGMVFYIEDGEPVTGWKFVDGTRYYFREDGQRASGWTRICNRTYYFGEDGLAYTGPRYVAQTGKMYLFSQLGVLREKGPVTVYGKQYELDPGCALKGYLTESSALAAAVLDKIGWDLRAAFDWSASLTYYGKETRAPKGVVHTDWYASYGFSYLYGNCYVMAATFYQMAKLLGYEVYYIEGGVGSYDGRVIDHSWTELVYNGETAVFDPAFTNEEHVDGFNIHYEQPGTWYYFEPVRVP